MACRCTEREMTVGACTCNHPISIKTVRRRLERNRCDKRPPEIHQITQWLWWSHRLYPYPSKAPRHEPERIFGGKTSFADGAEILWD